MIEQINIANDEGPGISQPGSLESLPSETGIQKKRAYTSIKSDEE